MLGVQNGFATLCCATHAHTDFAQKKLCCAGSLGTEMTLGAEMAATGGTSSRPQRRAAGARGTGEKRKASKKDDLRSKNREAQRRFREKQK